MVRLAFHDIVSFGVQNFCFQVMNDYLCVFSYYRRDLFLWDDFLLFIFFLQPASLV